MVVDNDDDEIMTNKTQGQMGLTPEIELSKPSVKQNAGDGDGDGVKNVSDQKEHAEKLHVSPFESAAATALDKGKHDFF